MHRKGFGNSGGLLLNATGHVGKGKREGGEKGEGKKGENKPPEKEPTRTKREVWALGGGRREEGGGKRNNPKPLGFGLGLLFCFRRDLRTRFNG